MVQKNHPTMFRSGALAKAVGLSADTIRYYEKIGVLPAAVRLESGYRVYPESALERVLVVQRALRVGFTLAELAELLKSRDAGGAPCQRVYRLAQDKLKQIKLELAALEDTEKYLKKMLSEWERRIRNAAPGQKSHLLYSLEPRAKSSQSTKRPFNQRRTQ